MSYCELDEIAIYFNKEDSRKVAEEMLKDKNVYDEFFDIRQIAGYATHSLPESVDYIELENKRKNDGEDGYLESNDKIEDTFLSLSRKFPNIKIEAVWFDGDYLTRYQNGKCFESWATLEYSPWEEKTGA